MEASIAENHFRAMASPFVPGVPPSCSLPPGINEFQYQPDAGMANGIYILEIITPEDRMVMKWLWEH